MYKWREISDIAGFSEDMTALRNAMVREANFVFSAAHGKVETDDRIAREFEAIKKGRERALDSVRVNIKVTKVQVHLLLDVLTALDFKIASFFTQYFGLVLEDVGKDIYFDMKAEAAPYMRLITEGNISTAVDFVRFFPVDDAFSELEQLFNTAITRNNNSAITSLLAFIEQAPYKKLLDDESFIQLLAKEYDRAEEESRLEDARRIVDLIKDPDRSSRLKVVEALLANNYEQAIAHLPSVKNKEAIRKKILEAFHNERRRGATDIEGLKRAFHYALHGGLNEGEYKRYLEEVASALFEHFIIRPMAGESDFAQAEKYVPYASSRIVTNIFAKRLLDLILNNETSIAHNLKTRFSVKFAPGLYDHEKTVLQQFKIFTETKGMLELPKGEENLQSALDIVSIFDLPEKDKHFVMHQLCKYYIINKKYNKAKKYFVAGSTDINELITDVVHKRLEKNQFAAIYELLEALPVTFDKDIRARHNKKLRQRIRETGAGFDFLDMARAIVETDVFDLKILNADFYYQTIDFAFEYGDRGLKIFMEIKRSLYKENDNVFRVKLHRHINQYEEKDKQQASNLRRVFTDVLPPGPWDWIIYFIRKLFGI